MKKGKKVKFSSILKPYGKDEDEERREGKRSSILQPYSVTSTRRLYRLTRKDIRPRLNTPEAR
ncbi:hypothetical protein AMTR_s00105p00034430 [Amborella trichopoda]|uniref:Uncharacterized protein n=1 Tax=Amborella trichopoda TaxID=13333 RepID=W1NWK6_AMBTC|nr:hypothetical protein AMTR_s00105p00034430 [Amborella trichopoda]